MTTKDTTMPHTELQDDDAPDQEQRHRLGYHHKPADAGPSDVDLWTQDICEAIPDQWRGAASQGAWVQAIHTVIDDYADYTLTVSQAASLCENTLESSAYQAYMQWQSNKRDGQFTAEALIPLLQGAMVRSLAKRVVSLQQKKYQSVCTKERQRYLLDHDIGMLCRTPAVIIEPGLRAQVELKHPGILAMAALLTTLYDDQADRSQAMHDWLAQEKITGAGLDTLGQMAPS